MLKLFNSLTKSVEEFKPINPPKVSFYGCGPTVYDHIHIGNTRSFVMYDVLRRTLIQNEFDVTFVQNITDIEDKIIKRATEMGVTPTELTEKYTKLFFDDLEKLNILPANNYPKATEHVSEMVKFIEVLLEKGLAYKEEDGSVYFDVSEFSDYGKLSGVDKSQIKSGMRILSDEYSKDDVQDFALWKSVEGSEMGWDSPWGKGRPGWHIECSVMSSQYLGDTIDIHAGGVDLLFPHHENEIAQSEGVSGKTFVNYWVHGEHLLVDNKKMSKSLDNFYTLKDIEEKDFEPLALRYLFLTANYRDKLNFTWDSLTAAQNALNNLREKLSYLPKGYPGISYKEKDLNWQDFMKLLNNDLNTAQALAFVWNLLNNPDYPDITKASYIYEMDKVLGLNLAEFIGSNQIQKYILPQSGATVVSYTQTPLSNATISRLDMRELSRTKGDFHSSDEIRDEIRSEDDLLVQDTPAGTVIKKAN